MIGELVGSEIDVRQSEPVVYPASRVMLFSRWQDSDSAIFSGTFEQTPIDITPYVVRGALNLAADRDASSLTLVVSLEHLPADLFANCAVVLYEGLADVDPAAWPATFSGVHLGQPSATESNIQQIADTGESLGERGVQREVTVAFVSRSATYRSQRLTSPGLWIPRGVNKNPDAQYAYRDAYDDVGSIAREIATASWGMGLLPEEVLIGQLPFRIAKQLQIVQEGVLAALDVVLMPLHLRARFDGRGRLTTVSERPAKTSIRSYPRARVVSVQQGQTSHAFKNAVRVTGLSSEITEVRHADQRLLRVQATFGFFDSEMTFKGTWGADDTKSYRVKLGTVSDGNGAVVQSPRISGFEQEGFIFETVYPPEFVRVTEYDYEIAVKSDVVLTVGLLASFVASYAAVALLTTTLPEVSVAGVDVPNPGAIAAEVASAALVLGAITVLQQIGNFSFEVRGVPYETVYEELVAEASLAQFAAFDAVGGKDVRAYERDAEEIENHVFSSIDDATTDDGTVNVGLERWAKERLAYEVARAADRQVTLPRDILLEPGDVIDAAGVRIYVDTVSREIQRGSGTQMSVTGFQVGRSA